MFTPIADNLYGAAGRNAIVTGATSGIGLEVARLLSRSGANVIVHGLRRSECELTAATIPGGIPIACDLSDPRQRAEFCQRAGDMLNGRIDVLVQNAAFIPRSKLEEESLEQWRQVMQVNVESNFDLVQHMLPCLRRSDGAAIVFVSSIVVRRGAGDSPAYVASKAAQIGLARNLAAELGPLGIRVNVVLPGLVDTPSSRRVFSDTTMFESFARDRQMLPLVIQPEDVAHAVVFLCTPVARAITAACLDVNAGHMPAA